MKKNLMFAMFGAIALTGAVGLTACSESEDVVDVNPTFDGETVKTQFTISLPFNKNASTRQTSAVVQQAEDISSFRGMENIVLIPFQDADARTTRLGANIILGAGKLTIPNPSSSNAENGIPATNLLTESKAVLFSDVTIPVGTSGFLFYGKTIGTDGYENGSLTLPTNGTTTGIADTHQPSDITFTPTPIKSTLVSTKGVALATYVKLIAAAAPATGGGAWWKCASNNTEYISQAWYSASLGDLYKSFISMKAGASKYVLAAIQDLYSTVRNNTDVISVAIKNAIYDDTDNHTYVSAVDSDGKLTFKENITGYPGEDNNGMPDGAAALMWSISATGATSAMAASVPTAVTDESSITYGGMNLIKMSTITYPASLYYYVNSAIKTSNNLRANYYDGDKDETTAGIQQRTWSEILGLYDGTSVLSTTRSVAINDAIQYAVGRLDVTVSALGSGNHYDRKGEAVAFPESAAAADKCFPLTGVLIGGQKQVGYEFKPTSSTSTTEYTIYDNTINTESPSAHNFIDADNAAGPTYTLALETAGETPVYVALEFVNNANDFQGYDGVVKHGCKFYMIAELNPSSDVSGKVSGVTNTEKKVFMQDHKTIANFGIGVGSPDANHDGVADDTEKGFGGFANAYVTIPDLRTPQLELGLSVNLHWEDGIEFTVEF